MAPTLHLTLAISLLFFSSIAAQESIPFQEAVAAIQEIENPTEDNLATASKTLAQVATAKQLASFLGEDSTTLQICAIRALGLQKEKAVLLYLGVEAPDVLTEVAKVILGPPTIAEGIPQLAKSLQYAPQHEELVSLLIDANALIGTPECANLLIRYTSSEDALLPMREKSLSKLLKFQNLTQANKDLIARKLQAALPITHPKNPVSPRWVSLALQLSKKVAHPFDRLTLEAFCDNLSQPLPSRIKAAEALAEEKETLLHLLTHTHISGLRLSLLSRWYEKEPDIALVFCRDSFGLNLPLHQFLDQRLVTRDQEVLQFLTSVATPTADAIIEKVIIDLAAKDRLDQTLWLEIEEAFAARADSLSDEARQVFNKLIAEASQGTLPENAHPTLLAGGDITRGYEIALSKKGRCTECHTPTQYLPLPILLLEARGKPLAQNLRALIAPAHDLSFGQGLTIIQLKDGTTTTGKGYSKSSQGDLHLLSEEGESILVKKEDIISVTKTSPMPSALDYLTHREIRDIVAYLSEN